MNTRLIRHAFLLGAVMALGSVLSSLSLIRRIEVGRWSLDTLVGFAAFTLAAMIAVTLTQLVLDPEARALIKSPRRAGTLAAFGYGLTAWLLVIAVRGVLVPGWVKGMESVFAAIVVVLVSYINLAQFFQAPSTPGGGHRSLLTRLLTAVGYGLSTWLLTMAVGEVLMPAWGRITETVFAVVIVALGAYVLWIVFTGFDEIDRAFRGVARVAAASSPPAPAPPHCRQCGAAFQAGQQFCGACGAPRG